MKTDADVGYRKFKVLDSDTTCWHPRCEVLIPAGEKVFHARLREGYYCSPECRERHTRLLIQVRRRNEVPGQREYERNAKRLRKYGITPEKFRDLLAEQLGGCAICGLPLDEQSGHVDHDHASGRIRGILCSLCNPGLGYFHDDPNLLERAMIYLASATSAPSDGKEVNGP